MDVQQKKYNIMRHRHCLANETLRNCLLGVDPALPPPYSMPSLRPTLDLKSVL